LYFVLNKKILSDSSQQFIGLDVRTQGTVGIVHIAL